MTSPTKRVWRLAWPNILSNLLFTTVGFLHIKIVAQLGTSAVAAVTTGHRVFFLIQAIFMGLSIASTAMVARSWGAQEQRQAEQIAWTSLVISVALAALIAIPVLTIPFNIASLFGLTRETTLLAADFIFYLGMFTVFSTTNMMLSTALRATGDVITPLYFLFLSSLLNAIFSYVCAFGVGPVPKIGVAGVALGGGAATVLVCCLFVLFWWRGNFQLKAPKRFKPDTLIAKQLLVVGAPAIIEQAVIQIAFLVFFAIVAQYGTAPYAAYGIGISLVSFSLVVGFGFGVATATIVGQQLGANDPNMAVAATWRSMRMAMAAMLALSLLLSYFAQELAEFMIADPDVIHLTVVFIYMIAFAQPIMACEFTLAGALRGAGDTRFPLIATFCGLIIGRLIPAITFTQLGFSVYWVFAVMIIDYSIKASLLLYRFQSKKWLNIKFSAS